jgi:hypothetical protein
VLGCGGEGLYVPKPGQERVLIVVAAAGHNLATLKRRRGDAWEPCFVPVLTVRKFRVVVGSLRYLLAEGCDRLLVVPVHPEYVVQTCASKQFLSALVGRDQLEFATAVSRRDQESN